jgi:hypothetical protein
MPPYGRSLRGGAIGMPLFTSLKATSSWRFCAFIRSGMLTVSAPPVEAAGIALK